jgi:ferric-dicitrate binding protein FerR (iron transport regulator)
MRFPSPEFDEAVAAACQGTADEACLEALGTLLAESDAALDAYLHKTELHAALVLTPPSAISADAGVSRNARPHASLQPRPGRAWAFALVSAASLLFGGLWLGGPVPRRAPSVGTPPAAAARTVGRFSDFEGVVWVRPDTEAGPGDEVRSGQRIELAGGSARIELTSGATVKLTGPAIFDVESPLAATLTMGRVTVTADTPESKGFTIRTRTGRIVDLGTQFTADAAPDGRCRVGVARGSVRFHHAGSGADADDAGELIRAGDLLEVHPGRRRVVTRIERGDESAAFRFPSIEPPSADDLADASRGRTSIRCVRGMLYANPAMQVTSAAPEILIDGKGQSGPDAPEESLYFADGEEGGLVLDLGAEIPVRKVNVYSWHRCLNPGFPAHLRQAHRERAAQHYLLYGRGADPAETDGKGGAPGWTFIARVNSDEYFGLIGVERPAQQASSVTAARGTLGRFRHLLFVVQPTVGMNHDGRELEFGTFCGEIDVYGE